MAQVPFLIVHPGAKRAGESSEYFASTHDVAPTVLSLLGIDRPRWMEGEDLSVLLDDDRPGARPFHYGGMYNRYFIRTDQWVLLGDNLGGNRQLFDLTLDPGEFENVADAGRANRRIAEELYQQVIESTGGRPLPYYDDTKLQAQLLEARARKGYADPTP
jgi:arylsulfatase A-like enzyme